MEMMRMILQMLGMGCLIVVALILMIFLIACLVAVVKSLSEKK